MNSAILKLKTNQKGFTLIELLIVIGILAVLMGIVLIAINPAKQFSQSNNTARQAAVNAILNSISQYQADNHGNLPTGITSSDLDIRSASGGADICPLLVTTYIAALPFDPTTSGAHFTSCSDYDTGYHVTVSGSNGRVTVSAPGAEPINGVAPVISVTR